MPVVVEQIVPLASAQDGVNAFEVRARLVPKDKAQIATFRPGVEGQARLDGPEMSLIGIASRRIVDQPAPALGNVAARAGDSDRGPRGHVRRVAYAGPGLQHAIRDRARPGRVGDPYRGRAAHSVA